MIGEIGRTRGTVRVRGVCYTQFNRQHQLFNFALLVPRLEDLIVEKPAPADPFDVEAQPLTSLLQYSAQGSYGHRLKVAGTVTLRYGDRLYIQDEQQGLCVQTVENSRVAVGDPGEDAPWRHRPGYRSSSPS